MNLDKVAEFIDRWKNLYDLNASYYAVVKDQPNKDAYFKDKIINEPNFAKAEKRLKEIEKVDNEIRKNGEKEKQEAEIKQIRKDRVQKLLETDYTQLADSPINTKQKIEYREYRKYLREIPKLYERKQILELKVMSFEDWKNNKPIFK